MTAATGTFFPDTAYWRAYRGRFAGILDWAVFDAFWQRLAAAPEGWFVFEPETAAGQDAPAVPTAPADAAAFAAFLARARPLLEARRSIGHCGVIYADDLERPAMVKLFDPVRMGSSCSVGTAPVLPRWILSRIPPDPLPRPAPPKPGLWRRLRGG